MEMIQAAAEAGADVAKFQCFEARTLFSKENNPWYEYNLSTEISKDQVSMLAESCNKFNIEFMASAFDVERVRWLESVNVKRHKLASRSIDDPQLIEAVTKTEKPILVSLGFWEKTGFPQIDSAGNMRAKGRYLNVCTYYRSQKRMGKKNDP